MRPPNAPLAAAARPHLVLRLGRARPWYAERMGSLTSTAQLWSRARPAHAVRARSPRRAFAHQAGGGACRRILTVLWCAGTEFSCSVAADCVEVQPIARSAHGVCAQPRPSVPHAHVHLQPTYRFPMFDSLQLGTCASTAITTTIGNEVAVIFFAAACSFFDESMLARAPRLLPRVTARRRGAARRRSRWLWRRTRAAAIFLGGSSGRFWPFPRA